MKYKAADELEVSENHRQIIDHDKLKEQQQQPANSKIKNDKKRKRKLKSSTHHSTTTTTTTTTIFSPTLKEQRRRSCLFKETSLRTKYLISNQNDNNEKKNFQIYDKKNVNFKKVIVYKFLKNNEFKLNNEMLLVNSKLNLISGCNRIRNVVNLNDRKNNKKNFTIKMCQQKKKKFYSIIKPQNRQTNIINNLLLLLAIIIKLSFLLSLKTQIVYGTLLKRTTTTTTTLADDLFESQQLKNFIYVTTNLSQPVVSELLNQQTNQLDLAFNPTRAPKLLSENSKLLKKSLLSSNLTTIKQKTPSLLASVESRVEKRQSLPPLLPPPPPPPPPSSGSSTKFIRTNELDVFLDDMNHNELRTVASGQTINDLFRPKLIQQPSTTSSNNHQQFINHNNNNNKVKNEEEEEEESESNNNDVSGGENQEGRSSNNKKHRLDSGSASDRQIYSECALILQRTYVKNINDPKHHSLIPFGKTEQACISYKHIDKAIEQAKHNLKFRELDKLRKKQQLLKLQQMANIDGNNLFGGGLAPPAPLPPFEIIHSSLEPPEDLIAAIGEINMATTQIIADQFDLSNDELLNGLPLIDMSKTKFWQICPLLVKQDIKCQLSRFRTFTGHCNNLKHPTWGAAMTPFARYLPPIHPDGIWLPRKSIVSELTIENNHHIELPTLLKPIHHVHNHHHDHYHENEHYNGDYDDDDSIGRAKRSGVDSMSVAPSVQLIRHAKLEESPMITNDNNNNNNNNNIRQDSEAHLVTEASHHHAASENHHHHHHQHQHQHRRKGMPAQELPSARLVTSIVHRDIDLPSHDFSILFMSWGQMLDHDMTRAAQPPASIKCCESSNNNNNNNIVPTQPQQPKHKLCFPIKVPKDDPLYSKFNVNCLEFRRSLAGLRPNCVLGPRVHQNAITSAIDANFVYGSSKAHSDSLRLFKAGRLRDRDWFRAEGLKPLLPAQDKEPDQDCIARPKNLFCFLAGDVRANEQTHLTVLHTIYMREHNRMADKLSELNPHWEDERIFQEVRHIMAAGVQNVMITEYIPLLIGKKMTELYNLTASSGGSNNYHFTGSNNNNNRAGYWHGYDPTVTTSVSNSFAAAAFRQGHTFVQGTIERYNKFHEFVSSERLRHLFKQPFLLYKQGVLDELVSGMINQQSQSYDPFMSEDISGHLFQPPNSQIGHDLPAINLQRGREQGLPGYNLFREWCGLPRAETFEQLEPYLTNHTAFQYSRLYKHVDDIDLFSGGISERKLPGAAIGPTFACIIARQFSNTRRGDRFWFENPNLPSSFTPEQLNEIRKISLAKLLCTNSDDLPTIQQWALRMPHPVLNPRVSCDQLPEIDLQYWQEE